ncbi:G8 domain-containing protein [Cognatiyoonia koreensis]|uniref:G8 domain-containing protein n=1 Tax=Cognatiyoonia koreensis TaxID=364200 RepID=A0A1I0RT05_9RHOB|nr:G8 domain-containing protein [Cognatiyoonia koreensis]SEW44380.1 G8 domain-containing protein [Cognatiyoonia koreensis]
MGLSVLLGMMFGAVSWIFGTETNFKSASTAAAQDNGIKSSKAVHGKKSLQPDQGNEPESEDDEPHKPGKPDDKGQGHGKNNPKPDHDDPVEEDHDHPSVTLSGDTPEEIEAFVQAVRSAPEAHAHGDHSGMAKEHLAALDLVPRDEATHIAVRDGDWDDPDTWYQGNIPGDGSRVLIPEGVHVHYDFESDARIFTLRVDGELEFATDTDSKLVVDTFVASPTSKLVMGTEDNPVDADVNIDIIFANNGAINVDWDPMLLSRGLIAHGEVSIHGTEKDSHEKVIEDPMAGDKSVTFAEAPTGWAVGDTIVIAGTTYEGYYDWQPAVGYIPSQDEVRVISSIDGNTIHFDEPLEFDHDTPRADLKTSVANYTRNVSFETEDADFAEVSERGHVMFMHNDDVEVRYAEFHELGRTDKSTDASDVGDLDEVLSDSNVKGRYSLHIHRAGVESEDQPAILEGNAVFGSPGWGYVHHDSHAILDNNASFNTFGAGYVAESGNETGVWSDNIAIFSKGMSWQDPKGINASPSNLEDFDMGRSGDGFWFQGRMIESTDNVAASVHNGFVYFHRGFLADDSMLTYDASVTDLEAAFHYDDAVRPDTHPILGFHGNEAFASKAGVYVLKGWFTQDHAISTVMDDFTAWNVKTGADLAYTGHYILKDFDLVSRDFSEMLGGPGAGIDVGNNTIDLTIINPTIEGFKFGIDLEKTLLEPLPKEMTNFTVIDATLIDNETDYRNYDPELDTIISSDDLPMLTPDIELDDRLTYSHTAAGGNPVYLTGVKSDSLGEADFVDGPNEFKLSPRDVLNILEEQGYFTTSDGEQYFVVDIYFSDRLSGDIYVEKHPVFVQEGSGLGEDGNWWFRNVEHNGEADLGGPDDPTFDAAQLWATLVEGQPVISDDFSQHAEMDDAEMDHMELH